MLLLSNLPESYWGGLHTKIEEALLSPDMAAFSRGCEPGQLLDFTEIHNIQTSTGLAYILAVAHAVWHHSGFNQLCGILDLVRDKLVKLVETEEQMLFIFHLVRLRAEERRLSTNIIVFRWDLFSSNPYFEKKCTVLSFLSPCRVLDQSSSLFLGF